MVCLGGPHKRFVQHFLRIIGRLPRREATVRAIEAPVRTGARRPRQLPDQLQIAKAGGNAQVERIPAEQLGDLAMAPEQRRDKRCSAIAAREQVGPCTG